MGLNSVTDTLFPAHYNHIVMDAWRRELGLSIRAIARLLDRRHHTIRDVFQGRASSKTVFPVVQALGMDWAKVHDLSLRESDYPRAVRIDASRRAQLIAPERTVSNST